MTFITNTECFESVTEMKTKNEKKFFKSKSCQFATIQCDLLAFKWNVLYIDRIAYYFRFQSHRKQWNGPWKNICNDDILYSGKLFNDYHHVIYKLYLVISYIFNASEPKYRKIYVYWIGKTKVIPRSFRTYLDKFIWLLSQTLSVLSQ